MVISLPLGWHIFLNFRGRIDSKMVISFTLRVIIFVKIKWGNKPKMVISFILIESNLKWEMVIAFTFRNKQGVQSDFKKIVTLFLTPGYNVLHFPCI